MATFWHGAVRLPSLALCTACVSAGVLGVADWSVALAASLPFAFLAEGAGWAAHRAAKREAEKAAVMEAESRYRFITMPRTRDARSERAA